jgi:hypothetical protein
VALTRAIRPIRPRLVATCVVAIAAAIGAGCESLSLPPNSPDGASEDDASGDGGDSGDGDGDSAPPFPFQCENAGDCVAAPSTCCECPSFAVPGDSELAGACDEIECEPPLGCPSVEPACIDTQCELVCTSLAATQVCERGFARDGFGCLLDECRAESIDERFACDEDADCTQVQSDCCGCSRGGLETAVALVAVDEFIESLGCGGDPACPGVDVCDPGLVPRCIAQACTLAPEPDGSGDDGGGDDGDGDGATPSGDFCGVPDFPPCPPGLMCVLNHPDAEDATRIGLGTCR